MTNKLEEAVARAICKKHAIEVVDCGGITRVQHLGYSDAEEFTEEFWSRFLPHAKAAVAAYEKEKEEEGG